MTIAQRLEKYTINNPQEVLLVKIAIEGEEDQIAIYKGFSSSLMRPTAFDPDEPVIPEKAKIIAIDRLASPYNQENPHYLERGLSWEQMEQLLS